MKIIVKTLTSEAIERRDYQTALSISDGENTLEFYDGEPEDNNLNRNFSDCYSIPDMLRKAYEAGVKGESFEIVDEVVDEI